MKAEEGEQAARVRKTVEGPTGHTKTVYHFNQKKPTGDTGVHEETEHEISDKEYEKSLKKADPSKVAVEKTRFVFDYNDQTFELDLFKGHLKGLAIMEIELENMEDTVELPPFLRLSKKLPKTNDSPITVWQTKSSNKESKIMEDSKDISFKIMEALKPILPKGTGFIMVYGDIKSGELGVTANVSDSLALALLRDCHGDYRVRAGYFSRRSSQKQCIQ